MKTKLNTTAMQTFALVLLRILVGWHFMYEGIVKILNPKWTALGYLLDSKGPLSFFFISLTSDETCMQVVNTCNEWGLFLIGLGLITGCFCKLSAIGGMIMLALFYLSHPPLSGISYMLPQEGSYLWIDKNLIELAAMWVIAIFPTSRIIGIDRVLSRRMPAWLV